MFRNKIQITKAPKFRLLTKLGDNLPVSPRRKGRNKTKTER